MPFVAGAALAELTVHGFFGRQGGVSQGIFASLNCGPGSGDDPSSIAENRRRVAASLSIDTQSLISLHQIHSAACVAVSKPWQSADRPQADALVTDMPGLGLSVLTADCAPILFAGAKPNGKPVIGAAHAGWKGALGGVLEATIQKMVAEYGARIETIRASIGPCIQKQSYEVSDAFAVPFFALDHSNKRFFSDANRAGHLMFDLPGFCAARLNAAGVRNVHIHPQDTYGDETAYFSFRRTTHKKEPDYGRQISVVAITE